MRGRRERAEGGTEGLMDGLTPSLTGCHLKTTNKSAKFQILKPFCLLFRTGMWNDFHQNA